MKKTISTTQIDLPISVYIDRYLAERQLKSIPRDLHIFGWWKDKIGDRIATTIKPVEVEKLLESLKTTKTKNGNFTTNSTIRKYSLALGSVFNKAVKYWKWCEKNPVSDIRMQYKELIRDLPLKPRSSQQILEFKMNLRTIFEKEQGEESLYKYLLRLGLQKSTFNYMISESGNVSLTKLIYYLEVIGYKLSIEPLGITEPLQDNNSRSNGWW